MPEPLPNPLYYLDNFRTVLDGVAERYGDLLTAEERHFVAHFPALTELAQALLVRMVMRNGRLFRPASCAMRKQARSAQQQGEASKAPP